MKKVLTIAILAALLSSCVAKKKYVELEEHFNKTQAQLDRTSAEKVELEEKFAKIKERVSDYNNKINSLNETNSSLNQSLVDINNKKLVLVNDNSVVMSNEVKDRMNQTLAKMSSEELAQAKTLKDSMNLAISYSLRSAYNKENPDDDIQISIDKTVVMISVSDKMLFNTGSYRIQSKASNLLQKLANIINSEPSMDVIIEGHTDSRTISTVALQDNWDLSVKRATSIVRELQNKYGVEPSRLIASGRSSYSPIADNETKDGRARNRRTNIIIIPNLDKFFYLMNKENSDILD